MLSDKYTLNVVNDHEYSDIPTLITFPSGFPIDINNTIDETPNINFTIKQKTNSKKKKNLISSNYNNVRFEGLNFDDYNSKYNTYKYVIGVVNNNSTINTTNQVMDLYSIDHLYSIKPKIIDKNADHDKNEELTYYQRKEQLTAEFGSRKNKRSLQSFLSNIITSDNISGINTVEKILSDKFNEPINENIVEEAVEYNRSKVFPPYDIYATKLELAYPINGIITIEILKSIEEFIKLKINESNNFISTTSSFLVNKQTCSFIYTLVNQNFVIISNDLDIKLMKKLKKLAIYFIYLHYLIKFYININDNKDKCVYTPDINISLDIPEIVMAHILDTFTITTRIKGRQSYRCGKPELEKLLFYILVLSLHVSNFKINISILAEDLKLPVTVLSNLTKELGCEVDRISDNKKTITYYSSLILPLTFPKPVKPSKRRKTT